MDGQGHVRVGVLTALGIREGAGEWAWLRVEFSEGRGLVST